jgi:hypothetical protein
LPLERVIGGEYRIHVTGQEQAALGLGPDPKDQMAAVALGVDHSIGRNRLDRCRFDQCNRAGQRGKRRGERFSLRRQSHQIARAGIDCAPRVNLRQHGRRIDCGGQRDLDGGKLLHLQPALDKRHRVANRGGLGHRRGRSSPGQHTEIRRPRERRCGTGEVI